MQLLTFPVKEIDNLAAALRELANEIDNNQYPGAFQIAFIIDAGEKATYGLLGDSDSTTADFNLLLDVAKASLLADL